MQYYIRNEKIADLETIGSATIRLREALGGWKVLEEIPLTKWKMYSAEKVSDDILKIRKEHDRKKFSITAQSALRDLNRGLASLGLGQVGLEDLMEEYRG